MAEIQCARCGLWKSLEGARLLGAHWGGFVWSPLCLLCENPRFLTRYDRSGVAEDMPDEFRSKLHETCRDILAGNQDLSAAFRAGDNDALRRLTSKVMSKTLGQLRPEVVANELQMRIEAWPQIRRIEDDLYGVYDWGTEDWISTHGDAMEAEQAWQKVLSERGLFPAQITRPV